MVKKVTIKEASQTLKTLTKRMKTAQDEGTLSPDEVQEISMEISQMAETIADLGMAIEEGVPSTENGDESSDDETEDVVSTDESIDDRENISQSTDDKDNEKRMRDMEAQISQLTKDKDSLKSAQAKRDLAQKYAKLWQEPAREAKEKEFLTRKGSIAVLQAQVTEDASIMGDKQALRQAQLEDDGSSLYDLADSNDQGSSSGNISFGGKC